MHWRWSTRRFLPTSKSRSRRVTIACTTRTTHHALGRGCSQIHTFALWRCRHEACAVGNEGDADRPLSTRMLFSRQHQEIASYIMSETQMRLLGCRTTRRSGGQLIAVNCRYRTICNKSVLFRFLGCVHQLVDGGSSHASRGVVLPGTLSVRS